MVLLQSLYLVLISISSRLFVMTMMMNLVFAGPTGLTLRLIHSDSPKSPLYPGRNLTQLERMERAFQQTEARQQQLMNAASMNSWVRNKNNNSKSTFNTVRPQVYLGPLGGSYYMASLGIGTFGNPIPPLELPYQIYFFVVDTASDLLWLQCEECDICFPQDAPYFRWKTSTTYHPIPCNSGNPFCKYNLCLGDSCGYNITFGDGSNTVGVLATETLTVSADNEGIEEIVNFVFGCGKTQKDFLLGQGDPGENPVVGVLGLGGGRASFLRQLGDRGQMKFEYCLELADDRDIAADTFLRFGSDTKIIVGGGGGGQVVQSTPILFIRVFTLYYVIMYGISVDRTRIGYDLDVFEVKSDGTGGCIFDSGSPKTLVSTQVYDPLKDYLIEYFRALNIHTCDPGELTLYELCFERPNAFDRFPTITFHFTGGGFEIDPKAAFYIETHKFCLSILRNRGISYFSVIFGSNQQANHRVLYDVGKRRISWSKEECVSQS